MDTFETEIFAHDGLILMKLFRWADYRRMIYDVSIWWADTSSILNNGEYFPNPYTKSIHSHTFSIIQALKTLEENYFRCSIKLIFVDQEHKVLFDLTWL